MTDFSLNHRVRDLLYVLLAVMALALAVNLLPYHRDDAYITYRFAVNFAAGDGIVFNRGGPWVEGFSSPLWFFLLGALAAIFPPQLLPVWGVTLGLLSFGGVFYVIWRLSSDSGDDVYGREYLTWRPLIAGGLAGLLPGICYYGVTGLETVLFLLVVLVFAGSMARQLSPIWGGGAGLAAIWVRPEGSWLLVMAAVQLAAEGQLRDLRKKEVFLPLAAVLLSTLFLLLGRLVVFHDILPNTYYAKVPDYLSGLGYVSQGLLSPWGASVFLCGLAGAWGGGAKSRGYFAAGLAWLAAAVLEGGDWMPLGRMLLPALALFGIAAVGLTDFLEQFAGRERRPAARKGWSLLAVVLLSLAMAFSIRATLRETGYARNALASFHEDTLMVVELLVRSGAASVGLTDIGEVGFRSGLEIMDFAGLTDPLIAHAPGGHLGKEFDLDYLYEVRRPDLLLFRLRRPPIVGPDGSDTYPPEIIKWFVEHRIMSDERFADQYRLFCGLVPGYLRRPYDGTVIFRRRDFFPDPAAGAFVNGLQSAQAEGVE